MGDPKKLRKKYSTPQHPWNLVTIEAERVIKKDYGLKNKRELLIAISLLTTYKDTAKRLITDKTKQGEIEKEQLLTKLKNFGLLNGGTLDDVLDLQLKDIMERRLQSIVFHKGFARTMKQARQFVTHRHIWVGEKEFTSPTTIITLNEESKLTFRPSSKLGEETHPERINVAAEIKEEKEAILPADKVVAE